MATFQEALDVLSNLNNPTVAQLQNLAAQVTATNAAANSDAVTLFYSGGLEPTDINNTVPLAQNGLQSFQVVQGVDEINSNRVVVGPNTQPFYRLNVRRQADIEKSNNPIEKPVFIPEYGERDYLAALQDNNSCKEFLSTLPLWMHKGVRNILMKPYFLH